MYLCLVITGNVFAKQLILAIDELFLWGLFYFRIAASTKILTQYHLLNISLWKLLSEGPLSLCSSPAINKKKQKTGKFDPSRRHPRNTRYICVL